MGNSAFVAAEAVTYVTKVGVQVIAYSSSAANVMTALLLSRCNYSVNISVRSMSNVGYVEILL